MNTDKKLKSVHEVNADSVLQIAQLKVENDEYKERLRRLEELKNTWETRLDNQKKHSGDQYRALQEKYNQEVDARKKFEKDHKPFRRPWSQNKGRGRGRGRGRGQELLHTTGNKPPPLSKPLKHEMYLNPRTQQRASGLPLPIRPSTPIRPALSRDPGSSSSTYVSSKCSVFSRASPNESLSSVSSVSSVSSLRTVRSVSPSSPTTAKPRKPAETALDLSACPAVANEILKPAVVKKVDHEAKPSWANVVSLRPIQ